MNRIIKITLAIILSGLLGSFFVDFVSATNPPNLKIIKVQIEDPTKTDNSEAGAEFIMIYNLDDEIIDLNHWQIQIDEWSYSIKQELLLEPQQKLILYNHYFKLNDIQAETFLNDNLNLEIRKIKTGFIGQKSTIKLISSSQLVDEVSLNFKTDENTASAQLSADKLVSDEDGNLLFVNLKAGNLAYNQLAIYQPPRPLNPCLGVQINEIAVNLNSSQQFIELHNLLDEPNSLHNCQLKTNFSDDILTLTGELKANQTKAIFIVKKLILLKNQIGKVDFINESGEIIQSVTYPLLAKDSSYNLINDQWQISYAITPSLANLSKPYPDCKTGYERNQSTGVCHKTVEIYDDITVKQEENETTMTCPTGYEIGFTNSCVKICPAGYERSAETNRCRRLNAVDNSAGKGSGLKSIITCPTGYEIGFTGSCVKQCQPGEYRSQATNRCRKALVATVSQKVCPAGQELNPITNRCRIINKTCSNGYEIGFTGTCVKKCKEGFSRSQITNRCQQIKTSEDDVDELLEQSKFKSTSPPTSALIDFLNSPLAGFLLASVGFGGYQLFSYFSSKNK